MKKLMSVVIIGIMVLLSVGCGGDTMKSMTAGDYVQKFKETGLEAENSRDMKPEDFGPLPQDVESAKIFFFPSIGDGINGHVLVYKNQKDLEQAKKIYEEFGQVFTVHVFTKDNTLLHLAGEVNEDRAKQFESVLNGE